MLKHVARTILGIGILLFTIITVLSCNREDVLFVPGSSAAAKAVEAPESVDKGTPVTPRKQIELKYDTGSPDCAMHSSGGGFIVDFQSPDSLFTVEKIKMYGAYFGKNEGKHFELEILDQDMNAVKTLMFPITIFPETDLLKEQMTKTSIEGQFKWVEVAIPRISIEKMFYVHVYARSFSNDGIMLGTDCNVLNEHCGITDIQMPARVITVRQDWPYQGNYCSKDKRRANWMIRVIGSMDNSDNVKDNNNELVR